MSDKTPAAEKSRTEEDEADLALILTYARELQERQFYGSVTLTFMGGMLKHTREERTRPVAALASDLWGRVPEKVKPALKERLGTHGSFGVDS